MAIIIVSGLPRSGTSLMMQMLHAGGLEVVTDNHRPADQDNPRGYFEYEPVKAMRRENSWVREMEGKGVKVISALLVYLPADLDYKVVLMQRPLAEVLASQQAMLQRLNRQGSTAGDAVLGEIFGRQLTQTEAWLAQQPHISVLPVNYRDALGNPGGTAEAVARFIGLPLNIAEMARVVEPSLYRQKQNQDNPL
jgi:hypothetical protein